MTGIISDNVGRTSGLIKAASGGTSTGAWTLIKTLTASSDSTLSFVDGTDDVVLDSTYPLYSFIWINIHPSQQTGDGEEFQFNLSVDTGSNYNVTKTTTYHSATNYESDAGTSIEYRDSHDLAQGTGFQNISVDHDADNDASSSGEMWLYNPSTPTFVKYFTIRNNYMHSAPLSINSFITGYGNTSSAVDAVQFKFSAGNIDSGKIKLFGLSDS